jgi:hypothetical protein
VTGIVTVIMVVTGEHVIDGISRPYIIGIEVEDDTIARPMFGGRGRTPEKQGVHISQRPFWVSTVRIYRAEGIDRTRGRGGDTARHRCHNQPKRKRKGNDKLRLSRIND